MTYNDENLPAPPSLNLRDITLAWKRLRRSIGKLRIKYFYCGEYGSEGDRPHYHALLFNWRPDDEQFLKLTPNGDVLYTSDKLTEIWGKGFTSYGTITPRSIRYCLKYILKENHTTGYMRPFHKQSKGLGLKKVLCENKKIINKEEKYIPRYYIKKIRDNFEPDFMQTYAYLHKIYVERQGASLSSNKKWTRTHKLSIQALSKNKALEDYAKRYKNYEEEICRQIKQLTHAIHGASNTQTKIN
jgi:hypothetical protein